MSNAGLSGAGNLSKGRNWPRTVACVGVLTALTAMSVVVTHALSYLLSYPDASARQEALAGHEELHLVAPGLVLAGLATAALVAVLGWRGQRWMSDLGIRSRSLFGWQLLGFLGLEVGERLDKLDQLAGEPVVLVGALLQVPTAWLLIRLIRVAALAVNGIVLVPVLTWHRFDPEQLVVQARNGLCIVFPRFSPVSRRGPPARLV